MYTGSYFFVMGKVSYVPGTGLVYQRLYTSTTSESLYVNFQWAELDPKSGQFYVLLGNENAPDTLDARIYIYNFNNA